MDRFVNAFFRIRGSSNTTNSQNMPRTYVAEDMDKRVDTSMVWSMTVVNNPIWSFGFHFCDEEINITPSLLNPPHKHVHSSGDECLSTLKICPLEKFLDFGKWTLWFSYRNKFPAIEESPRKSTSDLGWGCMHRSSQMLIAQAFSSYLLGSNWKIKAKDATADNFMDLMGAERANIVRSIIRLFSDDQVDVPLSLHNIAKYGAKYGKVPSEWLGPATAGRVLSDIFETEQPVGFGFYLAEDGIIDESAVRRIASAPNVPEKDHWMINRLESAKIDSIKSGREGKPIKKQKKLSNNKANERMKCMKDVDDNNHDSDDDAVDVIEDEGEESSQKGKKVSDDDEKDEKVDFVKSEKVSLEDEEEEEDDDEEEEVAWKPTIVFVPLKLGVDEINPSYVSSLTAMFKLPQSIGMIGGKPHTSLYFLAAQDDALHYLDPHRVQETVSTASDSFPLNSWMIPEMRWIKCKDLDPSLGLGFLILSERDFRNFKKTIKKMFSVLPPLFDIVDDAQTLVEKPTNQSAASTLPSESQDCYNDDDDDGEDGFEVIN